MSHTVFNSCTARSWRVSHTLERRNNSLRGPGQNIACPSNHLQAAGAHFGRLISMQPRARCTAVAVATLALVQVVTANTRGQVPQLNNGCRNQLNSIFDTYYSGPVTDGQVDCNSLLNSALNNTNGQGCPAYDNMVGCLLIAQDAWIQLYSNCPSLFSPPSSCVLNDFTGSDCTRPNPNTNDLYVSSTRGDDMYTANSYDTTGILDNAGLGWEDRFYTGSDGEAAPARRRSLRQVQDNEGGGGGSGEAAGCWPDFYDAHDFSQWIQGSYQPPYLGGNRINPVGVIFWVLQALGIVSMAFI